MKIDVSVLGPLELRRDDVVLDLGTPKQRTVLALLVVHANRTVTPARLVEEVWPATAPNSAGANVTTYLSRLRRAVAGDDCGLERRDGGYVLRVRPEAVDAHRFTDRAERGDAAWRAGDPHGAAQHWEAALATWRGRALDGLPTGPELDAARADWTERRLAVVEQHARARLRLGRPAEVVAELRRHTLAEPLRETGWLLLMAALWHAGHPAAALDAYEQSRVVLGEQLGVDPGPRLRAMHRAVLAADEQSVRHLLADDVHDPRPAPDHARHPVPAQLPLGVPGFTGRSAELARLDAALARSAAQPAAVVIAAVSGMAGVGKTALALHWAHRRSARFPDGQLYVNLRGYDPTGTPASPAETIRGFLDALGVRAPRVPDGLAAQSALYRTLMAGRRMLVLLDNARDADQVRTLLPGSPGCLVVVTSRSRLADLVALEGAEPVLLDALAPAEARHLLAARIGADRVSAEPAAIDEIVADCAGLPLALAVVAARAATNPQFSLADFAAGLREAGLDALTAEGRGTDVRALFSWSYQQLPAPAARLFRLLGHHPGPEVSQPAAASLAGVPLEEALSLLTTLTRANLLTEHARGRYTQHDLLRAYAAELAAASDDDPAAVERFLDHYAHTACAAAILLTPHRAPIALDPPVPGAHVEPPTTADEALTWFAAERATLVATVELAAGRRLDRHTWPLAWASTAYFARQGHHHEWAATQHAALRAAEAAGDRVREAEAHRALLRAYGRLARDTEADRHADRALALFAEIGNPIGQANTHVNLAHVLTHRGRYRDALHHDQQALELYRLAGDTLGEAEALNSVGWQHGLLGEHEQSLKYTREALALLHRIGAGARAANTLDSMGHAHHHLGDLAAAVSCYEQALTLVRAAGDRYNEADILTHLADTLDAAGRPDSAREHREQAETILAALAR
ncbi:BTAD domain-containing putative transcriptional regulator [Dactylosporangium sp. AC04546]|uniref:AfsR/SARP family transcriptional regulator n=1 Tax=Dactylosporangium sp. AC04546 TaxID=2862460 RepID=UPI001EE086B1|nr:BTAD domain-containing putative transcriptional regulator [Dactylosporangium sp. AC04546]WVK88090.1 BTAD domain-containing putative transcriptional regulator [Dactylosporangium sp. AC04546]